MTNSKLSKFLFAPTSILPLVWIRILFGILVSFSSLRFIYYGWIKDFYVTPTYHFTYFGFDWVTPFSASTMYGIFIMLTILGVFITLGLFYRVSILTFFLLFTYVELIDKTYYLNHYYFVSLWSFLMIWVPANRAYSLDAKLNITKKSEWISAWQINIFKFQLAIVYVFAGIAKLNYYWLIEAQPLFNWLKHHQDFPLIGKLLAADVTAYIMSWLGCFFDLFIIFGLTSKRWVYLSWSIVCSFHILTGLLFPIGVFPFVMVALTTVFFPLSFFKMIFKPSELTTPPNIKVNSTLMYIVSIYVLIQILVPFRYLLYPNHLFWTEQGFRFSWRVMLIEKVGYAQFYISPEGSNQRMLLNNSDYLTPLQEKMMSTQPDMILQFAHYLRDEFKNSSIIENGITINFGTPKIYSHTVVNLYNKGTYTFIEENTDLAKKTRGFSHKDWVTPFPLP